MNRSVIMVLAMNVSVAAARSDVPRYRVDYLGEGWTATAINQRGDVCGSMSPDGTSLIAGVSRDGRPFESLPLPPGMRTARAFDINDAGVIVGAVCANQYVITQPTAAVWRPTPSGYEVEVFGALPGHLYSAAYALNNLGDIVGGSGVIGWNLSAGVRFTASGLIPLPEGFRGGEINDERVVMSGSSLLDLDTGQVEALPLPPGTWQGFLSADLNNNNDFCGSIAGFSSCSTFPIRYRHGAGWELLGGCGTSTSATSINDRGDTLTYYAFAAAGVQFIPEGYFMLDSLIDASQGPWAIQPGGANGINNQRQIIAAARQGISGPIGAVRLSPIGNCAPDFNGDGFVDFFDYSGFVNCFEAETCPPGTTGDFNHDGFMDFFDYSDFVAAFEAGC